MMEGLVWYSELAEGINPRERIGRRTQVRTYRGHWTVVKDWVRAWAFRMFDKASSGEHTTTPSILQQGARVWGH